MKQYLVTACEMKQYDANTIVNYHIPSLILMERAALVTVEEIRYVCGEQPCRVLVVAGCGNNGGDGLAAGRLLMLLGYEVTFVLLGDEGKCSEETAKQIEILKGYQARVFSTIQYGEYDIVIDAVFGIGLSRPVEGAALEAIRWINQSSAFVCSVDIPSGILADTGEVMGEAVRADLTVTYGFCKIGHVLYPGVEYTGRLTCGQMGIDERSFLGKEPGWYTHTGTDSRLLPVRKKDGNKGTFGKVLVIAGNGRIAGAAMLSAKSAFYIGAGMVKVVTAAQNREVLQQYIPEAMILTYEESRDSFVMSGTFMQELKEAEKWADVILVGPGIGTSRQAHELLKFSILESRLPLVIDADGLNLLAQDKELMEKVADRKEKQRSIILTPHLGEFSRLYGCTIAQAKKRITEYPVKLSAKLHAVVVCKDARTVVVCPQEEQGYINTTGNSGMATAGSGDVLAGMIAGLLAQKMSGMEAAVSGVYLHGLAGDLAADRRTQVSMVATDLMEGIRKAAALQIKTESLGGPFHDRQKSMCRDSKE